MPKTFGTSPKHPHKTPKQSHNMTKTLLTHPQNTHKASPKHSQITPNTSPRHPHNIPKKGPKHGVHMPENAYDKVLACLYYACNMPVTCLYHVYDMPISFRLIELNLYICMYIHIDIPLTLRKRWRALCLWVGENERWITRVMLFTIEASALSQLRIVHRLPRAPQGPWTLGPLGFAQEFQKFTLGALEVSPRTHLPFDFGLKNWSKPFKIALFSRTYVEKWALYIETNYK